jgi:uncharacterized protein YjbJ (UPF0337 family)
MNQLQFQGHWKQLKGKLKQEFGKLTEDDLMRIGGKRDELVGQLQVLYGTNKEKIEEQLRKIENGYYTDRLRDHWDQLQAKLKQKWTSLTEDDIRRIKGKGDQLISQLQQRYHLNREKAEEEFHAFIDSLEVNREKAGSHGGHDHRK